MVTDVARDGVDVLLVNPPYPMRQAAGIVPPVGLAYVASALRLAGARVSIVDLSAEAPDFNLADVGSVKDMFVSAWARVGGARLVGIGPLVTANLASTREVVHAAKSLGPTPVIVGGPLCAVPGIESVADCYLGVDAYVAGDGETPVVALWEQFQSSGRLTSAATGVRLAGTRSTGVFREPDLDVLPVPARDLLPLHGYHASARRRVGGSRMTAMFLSRGCPYSCSFCAAPLSSGKKVRRFSRARIEEELRSCSDLGFDSLIFYDDCLFVRSAALNQRVTDFAAAVTDSGWVGTFQLELRCDAVVSLTDDALLMLEQAGCRQINMGIEKGTSESLSKLRKQLVPEVAMAACDRLSSTGIRAAGTFILGGIEETTADLDQTITFACELALDLVHFNPLAIYPGTRLYRELFGDSDWLSLCLDPWLAPMGDILYQSRSLPLAQILTAVQEGYSQFYTRQRLDQVLGRTPREDRPLLKAAYDVLRADRGRSWGAGAGAAC